MSIELTSNNVCTGSMFRGNRQETTNVELNIIDGALNENIYGHVYFLSQCGNPNSGGLPFPKKLPNGEDNPDWGSPLLNGDGMAFRIDFGNNNKAYATSKLMKTPSFYADKATSLQGEATKNGGYDHFSFRNFGIVRMSLLLGPKNTLNTALIPVKFDSDSGISLLATNDVSRPWKIDPVTMEMITPIGKNEEWISGFPPLMQTPFPMFETTAHPSYDPETKEIYISNYTKSSETQMSKKNLQALMHIHPGKFKVQLEDIARRHEGHNDDEQAIKEIKEILEKVERQRLENASSTDSIWEKIINFLKKIIMYFVKDKLEKGMHTDDQVFLYSFDGEGEMKQNRIVDEEGHNLVIFQCMHQTSITDNYLVLMDSSFKFAFDLLVNNPFPNFELLDKFIRRLLGKKVLQYTSVWLVSREELRNAAPGATVLARKVPGGLPAECVHFTAEFDDSNDEITLYAAQNNASCLAEWVRTYDVNYFTNEKPDDNYIGVYAVGELSVNSIGKYVIDSKNAKMKEKIELTEMGNLPAIEELETKEIKNIGPNTWGIGLYAMRNLISPQEKTNKIKNMFFVNFGANPKILTKYIYNLYKNSPGRTPKDSDILLKYTEKGIPASVISLDTDTMKINGHYEFGKDEAPISIQFMPSKNVSPTLHPDVDGHIFMTVKKCVGTEFQAQVWIFKAWDLEAGPICKLASPQLNYCASIHSVFLPEIASVKSKYNINIREDFDYTINNSTLFFEKGHYEDFFNNYVYPHYENKVPVHETE